MGNYSWLQSDQINGGSRIDLGGTAHAFGFKNLISNPPIVGKDITLSYGNRIHEADYNGMENPRFKFSGRFESGLNTNYQGSVFINYHRLGSFALLGSPAWFYDAEFVLNPAGSTQVLIENLDVSRDNTTGAKNNDVGKSFRYSMQLVETKAW